MKKNTDRRQISRAERIQLVLKIIRDNGGGATIGQISSGIGAETWQAASGVLSAAGAQFGVYSYETGGYYSNGTRIREYRIRPDDDAKGITFESVRESRKQITLAEIDRLGGAALAGEIASALGIDETAASGVISGLVKNGKIEKYWTGGKDKFNNRVHAYRIVGDRRMRVFQNIRTPSKRWVERENPIYSNPAFPLADLWPVPFQKINKEPRVINILRG